MSLLRRTRSASEERKLDMAVVGCIWSGMTVVEHMALHIAEDKATVNASLIRLAAKGVVVGRFEDTRDGGRWTRWVLTE